MSVRKPTPQIDLPKRARETLKQIFLRYPQIGQVYIFGSRAMGTAHAGSDLDLAIFDNEVSQSLLRKLKTDFEESDLPFFVDVVYVPDLEHEGLLEHIERVGKNLLEWV